MTTLYANPLTSPPNFDLPRPKGLGYGARLGSMWVRLAIGPQTELRIYDQDSLAGRQAETSNPLENVLELGYVFARSDLSGGEGLDFFPRVSPRLRSDTDSTRFFDSANLDMRRPKRGEPYRVRLAHTYDEWYTAPEGTIVAVATSRQAVWVAADDTVFSFDDLDDLVTDSSHQFSDPISRLAVSPNDEALVLLDTGVLHYKPIGSVVWTVVPNGGGDLDNVVDIWFAKDRIVAAVVDPAVADATTLIEVGIGVTGDPDAPTITPVVTEVDSFYAQVTTVIDAGLAVLAATDDGYIRSYVPQTDTSGSPPVLTVRAKTPLPKGEAVVAMAEHSSIVVFLTEATGDDETTLRAYQAGMLDERFDFILGDRQLLREWRNVAALDGTARTATHRDEIVWTVPESDTETWLWRYDVATGGVFRHALLLDAPARYLATFQGAELFANDDDLWRQATGFQPAGYVVMPAVNFDLNTDINWLAAVFEAVDVLAGHGTQVEAYVTDSIAALTDPESPEWSLVARYGNPTSVGQEITLSGLRSKQLAVLMRLFPNESGEGTPALTRLGVRGFPAHRDWVVELPVAISDQIEVPWRRPVRIPGWGDQIYEQVTDLQGAQIDVIVFDPPTRVRGVVNRVLAPVDYETQRGAQGRMFTVQIVGNKVSLEGGSTAPTGDWIVGEAPIGVAIVGVSQSGGTS